MIKVTYQKKLKKDVVTLDYQRKNAMIMLLITLDKLGVFQVQFSFDYKRYSFDVKVIEEKAHRDYELLKAVLTSS